MAYFKNDLSLPCRCLKVKTKLKTKFCLRPFMNLILAKHKFCLNFVTKFLTFKTFILDLRQVLDLRPFVDPVFSDAPLIFSAHHNLVFENVFQK